MASSASLDELQKKFEGNQRRYLAPLANELRKTGDLEGAIDLCRAYLPEYPEHLSGYVVFGQALYEAGQLEDASSAFTAALALDPENLIALRHLGDIARDRGDREGAREWYQRVLDADPRNETIAVALQSLDDMPAGGPPASAAPRSPTPTATAGGAFEAPSLDFGMLPSTAAQHVTPPSLTPQSVTPQSSSAQATPPSLLAFEPTSLSSSDVTDRSTEQSAEPADDAVDFDPGFFDVTTASDEGAAQAESQADEERNDREALAVEGAHEVDPSELALAAALDAPIIEDPAPAAFDGDAAFDFQATALDGEYAADHGDASRDEGNAGPSLGIELSGFETTSAGGADDRSSGSASATDEADEADADGDAPFAPAYGGGFDADSFLADSSEVAPPAVTPPTDIGLESLELDAPERIDAAAPSDDAPFVTETMAELYLQQGFREEALGVYEQLLQATPDDDQLRERVERVRSGAPTDAGATESAQSVSEPSTNGTGAPTAPGSPTAREFFAALARRGGAGDEPDPSGGGGAPQPDESGADDSTVESYDQPLAADASHGQSSNGSLASLFGESTASDDDEHAASTLAALVGDGSMHGDSDTASANGGGTYAPEAPAVQAAPPAATPVSSPTVASAPSRPAARELSLDDVFGAPRPPARQTPNSSFSFDEFFADSQPAAPEPSPTPRDSAATAAPADESRDLEQFNAWLEGLKKR